MLSARAYCAESNPSMRASYDKHPTLAVVLMCVVFSCNANPKPKIRLLPSPPYANIDAVPASTLNTTH